MHHLHPHPKCHIFMLLMHKCDGIWRDKRHMCTYAANRSMHKSYTHTHNIHTRHTARNRNASTCTHYNDHNACSIESRVMLRIIILDALWAYFTSTLFLFFFSLFLWGASSAQQQNQNKKTLCGTYNNKMTHILTQTVIRTTRVMNMRTRGTHR